jgi:hypothetical protein
MCVLARRYGGCGRWKAVGVSGKNLGAALFPDRAGRRTMRTEEMLLI